MSNGLLLVSSIVLILIGAVAGQYYHPAKKGVVKYSRRTLLKYRKVNTLLNPAELRLYRVLCKRFNGDVVVVIKPRMGDLIEVAETVRNWKKRRALRNRVGSRHVDFCLMRANGVPVACIELDGRDHKKKSVRSADKFKDDICSAVGLALFRIPATSNYTELVDNLDISSL